MKTTKGRGLRKALILVTSVALVGTAPGAVIFTVSDQFPTLSIGDLTSNQANNQSLSTIWQETSTAGLGAGTIRVSMTPGSSAGAPEYWLAFLTGAPVFTGAESYNDVFSLFPGAVAVKGVEDPSNLGTYRFDSSLVSGDTVSVRFFAGPSGGSTREYTVNSSNVSLSAVAPEPSSTALLGIGGLALILRRRK